MTALITSPKYPASYISGYPLSFSFDEADIGFVINIGSGSAFDSSGQYQLVNDNPLTIDLRRTGFGGIESKPVINNKIYNIFIIGDFSGKIYGMISILDEPKTPCLCYKKIGYVAIDNESSFRLGYWFNTNNSERIFLYYGSGLQISLGTGAAKITVDTSALIPYPAATIMRLWYSMRQSELDTVATIQIAAANAEPLIINGAVDTYTDTQVQLPVYPLNIAENTGTGFVFEMSSNTAQSAFSISGYNYCLD